MESIWRAGLSAPRFPALDGDAHTEVLVIGGGITGILTAHFLERRGVPYLLLERGRICGGTTQNTTAKVTFQHGLCYDKLIRQHGVFTAHAYLHANRTACRKTSCSVISRRKIFCFHVSQFSARFLVCFRP